MRILAPYWKEENRSDNAIVEQQHASIIGHYPDIVGKDLFSALVGAEKKPCPRSDRNGNEPLLLLTMERNEPSVPYIQSSRIEPDTQDKIDRIEL